ncbi:DUF1090 family protein [Desulfovibrio inopinatus]|uniref:DUF1090 family protein n=1 Tax=Desulfovibrio inopinatus TaxID=102109 RepID=UPI000402FCD0|nr:DUF1090 family protein [Desulfovibrio inopinatus]
MHNLIHFPFFIHICLLCMMGLQATINMAYASLDCLLMTGCARKICEIGHEIASAKAHDNQPKVTKQEEALRYVLATCEKSQGPQSVAHELLDTKEKVEKFSDDIHHIAREFEKKIAKESRNLESLAAYEEAMDDIDEALHNTLDDLHGEQQDLEGEIGKLNDAIILVVTPAENTISAAKKLEQQIIQTQDALQSTQRIFLRAITKVIKLACKVHGLSHYVEVFQIGMEDIKLELYVQAATLKAIQALSQELTREAPPLNTS